MFKQIILFTLVYFLFSFYFVSIQAIRCYECQDVPPVAMNCSRMDTEGVVLSDCDPEWDACQTIVERVYNETILLRVCGLDDCKFVMNIEGLPGETFLSCQACYEDGCNNDVN